MIVLLYALTNKTLEVLVGYSVRPSMFIDSTPTTVNLGHVRIFGLVNGFRRNLVLLEVR